jgi:hypothetical protein
MFIMVMVKWMPKIKEGSMEYPCHMKNIYYEYTDFWQVKMF